MSRGESLSKDPESQKVSNLLKGKDLLELRLKTKFLGPSSDYPSTGQKKGLGICIVNMYLG